MSDFKLTTLIKSITDCVNNTDEINVTGVEQRLETLALLIGGVIGQWVAIPSNKVNSPDVYYSATVLPIVSNYVNEINESYPIDLELTLQASKLIWLERYKFVHSTSVKVGDMLNRISATFSTNLTDIDKERIELMTTVTNGSQEHTLNVLCQNLKTYLESNGNG